MPKNEEKALIISDYAIMQHDESALTETLKRNLGERGVTQAELDRIKVPAGGATNWSIPTIDGEISARELDAVIVAWKEPRAYWSESFDDTGGGTPPDCASSDGVEGVGDPGGLCSRCPFSKFGSARKGEGQACRQVRMMAILRKESLIPMILTAPPTSLRNMTKYFLRLAGASTPYYAVLTRFTLSKAKSKTGIDYAQIEATSLGKLSEEELKRIESYVSTFANALDRPQTVTDDFNYEE